MEKRFFLKSLCSYIHIMFLIHKGNTWQWDKLSYFLPHVNVTLLIVLLFQRHEYCYVHCTSNRELQRQKIILSRTVPNNMRLLPAWRPDRWMMGLKYDEQKIWIQHVNIRNNSNTINNITINRHYLTITTKRPSSHFPTKASLTTHKS